jgi:TctA family transporter
VGAVAFLLSLTFKMEPASAVIMLAGIYYGAMYGGSTTSILVNIPGETASVVTCLDGYRMARQGRAGAALGMAAFGSFIAGTVGVIGLMCLAPLLGRAALSFGPPEYFALTLAGLTLVSYLSQGSMVKALIMAILGLLAGTVGMDPISGAERFTYGTLTLRDGLGLVPVAMGLFGVAEVLENLAVISRQTVYQTKIKGLLPNRKDWRDSAWPIARGSALGFLLGIVPGPGPVIASFVSYAVEKRVSRYPEKFGTGVIAAQFNLLPGESKSGNVAYFSMEIGIDSSMPTYSGGLGILAGDTLRAAADLGLPVVGVTLLHRKGYFRQRLDAAGNQFELPATWNFEEVLEPMVPRVAVFIEERVVQVRAWRCLVRGVFGHTVPVYFLDTALEQNSEWDRSLTDALSEGDAHHRLCQEVVLGMGGVAMLQALSYKNVSTYHMNEGHAAFLTLGLLEREAARGDLNLVTDADREAVRQRCVFTTRTPGAGRP